MKELSKTDFWAEALEAMDKMQYDKNYEKAIAKKLEKAFLDGWAAAKKEKKQGEE